MSTDSKSSNALRSSASSEPDRIAGDGRRMSNRDIDEPFDVGFRRLFGDVSPDRRELSASDSVRVSPSRNMPRRPLNGEPPLRQFD